jgi:hypothetical protein
MDGGRKKGKCDKKEAKELADNERRKWIASTFCIPLVLEKLFRNIYYISVGSIQTLKFTPMEKGRHNFPGSDVRRNPFY